MKTYKLILMLIAFISSGLSLNAQTGGVYKTYADYTNGKMEASIDCKNEKGRIRSNDLFSKDYITVVDNGEKRNYKKNEIFGYQLCNGKFYRFLGKRHIPLAEKGAIWIYTFDVFESISPKHGTKRVTKYYFSMGGDDPIKYLSLENLKDAFSDNHKLIDRIDSQFSTDASLSNLDGNHKRFRINNFLESPELQ